MAATAKQPTQVRFGGRMASTFIDSLTNLISGMGTAKDKLTHNTFVMPVLDDAQIEFAYRGDWIARKVVDIPAKDATREWRAWQTSNTNIEKIEALENSLSVQNKTKIAITKARLYGGGALLMGVDQGDTNEPIDIEKVKVGSLKFIHALSKNELTAGQINYDITSPWFGEPEYYTLAVRPVGNGTDNNLRRLMDQRIHPSRVVRFIGKDMPDAARNPNNGWGDSVLFSILDAIRSATTVSNGFAQLVTEAKLDIISIPDLTENISNVEYQSRLIDRFGVASTAKSIYNLLLLDGEEKWQRQTITFTGMPDLLKVYLLIASGAADIPATRLLGQSPQGLSATGESDIRNYYDSIAVDQKTEYGPRLSRLDEVLIRSALGSKPDDIYYDWNPLWQMSEKEQSEIAKTKAEAFKIDNESGLFNDDVLREARANQLIEDGTYPGLEAAIDKYGIEEDEPDETVLPTNDPAAAAAAGEDDEPNIPENDPSVDDSVRGILDRIRLADATPRTLYVSRRVLNANEIIAWAKQQGFETTYPAAEMHVTIAYSKTPVDWLKFRASWEEDAKGQIEIRPGGPRLIEKFGDEVAVLCFTSSALSWRWHELKEGGCSWDYEDYYPHITISQTWRDEYKTFAAYTGKIVLGPEIWKEIKPGSMEAVVEE